MWSKLSMSTADQPPAAKSSAVPRWVGVGMERHDSHRSVTIISAVGLAAAVAMALWGLPAIDLHGPRHRWGVMGPTCGATRAAWFTAQGDLGRAWTYNPLGNLAVVLAGLAVVRTLIGLTTSRWVMWSVTGATTRRRILYAVALVLVTALEVRQQSRATLLMGP